MRRLLLLLMAIAATALAAGCGVEDPYADGVPSGTTGSGESRAASMA